MRERKSENIVTWMAHLNGNMDNYFDRGNDKRNCHNEIVRMFRNNCVITVICTFNIAHKEAFFMEFISISGFRVLFLWFNSPKCIGCASGVIRKRHNGIVDGNRPAAFQWIRLLFYRRLRPKKEYNTRKMYSSIYLIVNAPFNVNWKNLMESLY